MLGPDREAQEEHIPAQSEQLSNLTLSLRPVDGPISGAIYPP